VKLLLSFEHHAPLDQDLEIFKGFFNIARLGNGHFPQFGSGS